MTAPASQVLSEAAERTFAVTPEMQAAWVNYDPIRDYNLDLSAASYATQIRHAFLSGYRAAALAKEQGR